jgi:hypothetical protein
MSQARIESVRLRRSPTADSRRLNASVSREMESDYMRCKSLMVTLTAIGINAPLLAANSESRIYPQENIRSEIFAGAGFQGLTAGRMSSGTNSRCALNSTGSA